MLVLPKTQKVLCSLRTSIPPSIIFANGRDASTTSPASQSQTDLRSLPTTHLRLDHLASLTAPVFSDIKSRFPTLEWVGVFGSVSRGTQRPDSDIDVLVGHASGADFLADVCGALYELLEALPRAVGREVDVVNVVRGRPMGYVQMEGLLTSKTLWGAPSWPRGAQVEAEALLKDGYRRTKDAADLADKVFERLPSSEVRIFPIRTAWKC